MSEQKELIFRVEAKKKELQAELTSMKNDISESAVKKKKEIKEKVETITNDLKNANENFSEAIAKKINVWLS